MKRTKLPLQLTVSLLDHLGACRDRQEQFCRIFPGGTFITLAACLLAQMRGLPLGWLVRRLASTEAAARFGHRYELLCVKHHNRFKGTTVPPGRRREVWDTAVAELAYEAFYPPQKKPRLRA